MSERMGDVTGCTCGIPMFAGSFTHKPGCPVLTMIPLNPDA